MNLTTTMGGIALSLTALAAMSAAAGAKSSSREAAVAAESDGAFMSGSKFGETSGAGMYRRVCAGCHMPDGEGAVGAGFYPALAKNENLAASGYPVTVLLNGLNGMPPLGEMMTDQQIADVVNYVRTNFGNKYKDAVKPADVAPLR